MNRLITAFCSALFLVGFSGNAHAYLDPGTGSILLQALVGGIATILVVGRRYWSGLKRLLGLSRDGNPRPEQPIDRTK